MPLHFSKNTNNRATGLLISTNRASLLSVVTGPAGTDGITELTGDVTAIGPGSSVATLGTVALSKLAKGTSGYALIGNGASDTSYQGFLQTGTGATTRTWLSKAQDAVHFKDFTAVGDDSTDDTAAIQAAINSLPALGGRIQGEPGKVYKITSTLNIGDGSAAAVSTKYGIEFVGFGAGTSDAEYGAKGATCTLKWYGAAGGTMVSVKGPIRGVTVKGLAFHCNDLADTALLVTHANYSRFEDLTAFNYKGVAFIETAYDSPASVAVGGSNNIWDTVGAVQPGTGGSGMTIGAASYGSSPNLNVARNIYRNMELFGDGTDANAWALKLQFTDNISFHGVHLSATGGTSSKYLYIVPPSGNTAFPGSISFFHSPIGGVTVDATWVGTYGIGFFPYPTGDGQTIPVGNAFGDLFGFTDQGVFFGGFGGVGGSSTIASATTTQLISTYPSAPKSNFVAITGTTQIQFFGSNGGTKEIGTRKVVYFSGTPNLVHSASLVLPGSQNYQTVAGDIIEFLYGGSGVWYAVGGTKANGQPIVATTLANISGFGANVATFLATPSSANLAAALTDETGTGTAVFSSAIREKLSAARTYYVRTDGSDSNTGLADSAGGAFLTGQTALNLLASSLDLGGQTVTIQFGDGTFSGALTLSNWVGSGEIVITGQNTTGTILSGGVTNSSTLGGTVTLTKVKVTKASGTAINNAGRGLITIGASVEVGTASSQFRVAAAGARIVGTVGYTVSASADYHWDVSSSGWMQFEGGTITVSGTPAWAVQGLWARSFGQFRCTATISGSATGKRYQVENGGYADVNGAGINYLPGDSAGAGTNLGTSPYGHYA